VLSSPVRRATESSKRGRAGRPTSYAGSRCLALDVQQRGEESGAGRALRYLAVDSAVGVQQIRGEGVVG
jgi:hypothetical protein